MSKKLLALCGIFVILLACVAYAAYDYLNGDQTATAEAIEAFLNDTELQSGDTIDWGNIIIGTTYYYNLSVTSHYTTDYIISFLHPNLPTGWVQTWDCNNTLLVASESMWGWLNLTATTVGTETWGWNITVTAPP